MARTETQRERSTYRKTQAMIDQTHGGNGGQSIIEMLVDQLDITTARYFDEMRDGTQKGVLIARGEIRGLARAICLMRNPYQPTANIKQTEKASADRVRSTRAEERTDAEAV